MSQPIQVIEVKPGHIIKGRIVDGMVHVVDIIHEGASEKEMTGHTPHLKPIHWSRLKAMGAQIVGRGKVKPPKLKRSRLRRK